MLLKVFNKALITDREKTYLAVALDAGVTSLTVTATDLASDSASSNTWSNNDYMIVGEIGEETAEIMQVSSVITSATAIPVDREGSGGGTRFVHAVGTPVHRILFNQARFAHSTSNSTVDIDDANVATIPLQFDDQFTRFEDGTNSTGFGFVRFRNSTTGGFSSFSAPINYEASGEQSSRDPRTLWTMRQKVRQFLNEWTDMKLKDEMIDAAINDKQRDVAHMAILWSFFEVERSLSAIADQFAYDIPSTVMKFHTAIFDTQPLIWLNRNEWNLAHFDTDRQSSDPHGFHIWDNQFYLLFRPADAAGTTAINDAGGLSATATSVTVDSTSAFRRGDYLRFIINSEVIYATVFTDTTFSGLLRGQEGTTAAAHANNDTITERNIVYTAHVEPTDLIDISDRTVIPEPEVLCYGAAESLAPYIQKEALIPYLNAKYEGKVQELKSKYSLKQTGRFGHVKDMNERLNLNVGHLDPNLHPFSVNT